MRRKPLRRHALSWQDRESLPGNVNVNALEQLLSRLPAKIQRDVLASIRPSPTFQLNDSYGTLLASGHPRGRSGTPMSTLIQFKSPKLQAMFERVFDKRGGRKRRTQRQFDAKLFRTPILVVVRERVEKSVFIHRRPNRRPHDVIVLDCPKCTPKWLDLGVDRVLSERLRAGITPRSATRVSLAETHRGRRLTDSWKRRLIRFLRTIETLPPRHVEGVGMGRALVFYVSERSAKA